MKFILGKKIGMSQVFKKEGEVVPVTLIEAGPCFVTQINSFKNQISDGLKTGTIQIGFKKLEDKKVKKSQKGKPYRHLKEFGVHILKYKIGDKIDVSIFEQGDRVKVSGVSKGKGFAGVVKKWGFSGMGASHGSKGLTRTMGSIGSSYPQRVLKGKKMPGRMGNRRTTIKNLEVAEIDKENNIFAVKGAIPGRRGTLLEIRGE